MAIITSVPRGTKQRQATEVLHRQITDHRVRPVKGGQKGRSEVFWMILAWFLSLVLAWMMGGVSGVDAVKKHPERVGLEEKERKKN